MLCLSDPIFMAFIHCPVATLIVLIYHIPHDKKLKYFPNTYNENDRVCAVKYISRSKAH